MTAIPYGVGKMPAWINYNKRELAELLFEHGDASYQGDTLDECSLSTVATGTEMKSQQKLIVMNGCTCNQMRGDVFIEYIYLFKDNRWHVSTQ